MTDVRGSSARYLNQIVAGHVGLVPDRDEAGDADVEALGVVEDCQPQRSALCRHGDATCGRRYRRKCRIQADGGIAIEQAHAVWSDQTAAGPPDAVDERGLAGATLFATLAEAGADHADRAHVLADALVDGCQDLIRRDDDHRQVNRSGDVPDSRVGGDPVDLLRTGMDRHHGSGEAIGDEIVQDLRADFAALAIGADDRDCARFEERFHRRRRGSARSRRGLVCEGISRRQGQGHAVGAVLDPCGHGEAGFAKYVEHALVVTEHVGVESIDAVFTRDGSEPFEQPSANTVTLQGVGHNEGHFGTIAMLDIPIETGKGDDAASSLDYQGGAPAPVCGCERPDSRFSEGGQSHEPVIAGVVGERFQELLQGRDIRLGGASKADGGPVPHHHVDRGDIVRHTASNELSGLLAAV